MSSISAMTASSGRRRTALPKTGLEQNSQA